MFYDSHNKYPELFYPHHVSCIGCPGITDAYIRLMEAKYGRGSAMWLSKVEGEFPDEDSFVLFDPRVVERIYDPEARVPDEVPIIGCDIADGGNCESVFIVRRGDVIIDMIAKRGMDTEKNADHIEKLIKFYSPRKTLIDAVGVGTGVYSALRRRKIKNVFAIKGSWDASDPRFYLNHRSEAYFFVSKLVRDGHLKSRKMCDRLKKDLLHHAQEPRDDGLFQVTPKLKILKAYESPDYSDALVTSYGHELSKPRKEVTGQNFLEINRALATKQSYLQTISSGRTFERRTNRFDMENM
jgi:hypothetical protein